MIGYKAFDKDLCCRGFQFEVGKTYTKETKREEMKLCSDGVFHFCRELHEIERCSEYRLKDSRLCEVIAGDVVSDGHMFGTNHLTILREIVDDEKSALINSGNCNSGDCNSGNCNSGDCNSGDCNSGNCNSGDCNSGDWNSGDWNSGDCNSGNCNSGDRNSGNCNSGNWNSGTCNSGKFNSGNWNSGDWNSGDWNSGKFNSGNCNSTDAPLRMFNKDTDFNISDVRFPDFFYFDLTKFVSYDTATDEERKNHKKEIETCGGFLRHLDYKDAWRLSWNKATDEDRRKVMNLPNWDNEVFKEISGIDVEKELNKK